MAQKQEIKQLKENVRELTQRCDLLEQLLIKVSKKNAYLEDRIVDLTSRSMRDNVVISGISESEYERCESKVSDFLSANIEVNCGPNDIERAHRMGAFKGATGEPRPMVVKLKGHTKDKVMKNTSKLKGKRSATGKSLYISAQEPEAIAEKRKKARFVSKELHAINSSLPEHQRATIRTVKGQTVMCNNSVVKPRVVTPSIQDTIQADPDELEAAAELDIKKSREFSENGSSFFGFSCKVNSIDDVRRAYLRLKIEQAATDDIMCAYSVSDEHNRQHRDYLDDKEHGGGYRCFRALGDKTNTAVFVSRSFQGVHIGPRRFQLIYDAAADALRKI